ncbi:hypothetical protein YC2023_108394 [Brassica napus]
MPYSLCVTHHARHETPYSLDREDSERRGHGLWLSDYTTSYYCDCVWLIVICLQVLTLSPKSGLGTGLGLVALGKDDRIAWCWTLGPPV